MHDIIAVVGPTASGKTGLAIGLAKALDGEVLSCDSMQLYRHMDIGTATPTAAEMDDIPHHMMNVIDPSEDFSVSRYVEMADDCLRDILTRGKRAVVCGGTGLYLDSLLLGRSFACPATGHRRRLEEQAEREGIEPIREFLRTVDPDAYARLPAGDHRRIIRAAEVYLETGITITEHNRRTQLLPPRYEARWIGLDFANRAALYARIDRRVELMMEQGLLEEIQALLDRERDALKSTARIRACVPTIRELSDRGAKVVLLAHQEHRVAGGHSLLQGLDGNFPGHVKVDEYAGKYGQSPQGDDRHGLGFLHGPFFFHGFHFLSGV